MPLTSLCNEILLCICAHLDESSLNALVQTSRHLYRFNHELYRRNKIHSSHSSALHWAAREGQVGTARFCLSAGHNVNAPSRGRPWREVLCGPPPLHIAIQNRQEDIVRLLLENGADADFKHLGISALHAAIDTSETRLAMEIIKYGTKLESHSGRYNLTPLGLAASGDQGEIVKLLLELGVDIEATNYQARSPLQLAIVSQASNEIIERLLDNGANIETKDFKGRTPLHNAVIEGTPAAVQLLLDRGASIEALDKDLRMTPLHMAIRQKDYRLKIMMLLDHGANIEAYHGRSRSPLAEAALNGWIDVSCTLLDRGALNLQAFGR